jgi:hypothetical protein
VVFVSQYIQEYEINHSRGWAENLKSYRYKYSGGVADFQKGINTRLDFHRELRRALTIGNSEELRSVVNRIMRWGGMKAYEKDMAEITNSFSILDSLERGHGEWKKLIGSRIASTSKIYAMYAPKIWSIYDSRVGRGIQTLVSLHRGNSNSISKYLKFQSPPGRNRGPVAGFKAITSQTQAILAFLYTSWLFRAIASRLNSREILLPEPLQNEAWSVYHIEMVFFMIGK